MLSSVTRYIWRWQSNEEWGEVVVSLKLGAPPLAVGETLLIATQPFRVMQVIAEADGTTGQRLLLKKQAADSLLH